jgi:hypothetical protein
VAGGVRRRLPLGRPTGSSGSGAAASAASETNAAVGVASGAGQPAKKSGGGSGIAEMRNNVSAMFSSSLQVGDDKPGLVVGPTLVLMGSLVFIVCVILLHIYGRVTRG